MRPVQSVRRAATLVEIFKLAAEQFAGLPAFCTRRADGTFEPFTFAQLHEAGLALGTALIERGLQAREHVALLADNRLEWIVADVATQYAGAASVPRGTDTTVPEIEYIVHHADARYVLVENAAMLARVQGVRERLPLVRDVFVLDRADAAAAGCAGLWDLVEEGRALRAAGDRRIEARMAAVQPEDLFTLIYTSGTTGRPKGVPLTHANIASQVRNLTIHLSPSDRLLSILPIWHIYERLACIIAMAYGSATYYTSIRTVADDLRMVRPTLMLSAPRVWESLYQRIVHKVHKAGPVPRTMFRVAYFFSRRLRHSAYFIEGRRLDMEGRVWWRSTLKGLGECVIYVALLAPYLMMDGLVTRKLRAAMGGRFRGTISGGGALPRHVDEFFNYIGIPVLEGYGLTETSPVLAVRSWRRRVIGTVGPIWPETQIRIVDLVTAEVVYPDPRHPALGRGRRGEIQVRGPQVMRGYYKDPELTARVFRDGWFATGDIGMITFNDCLKIVGRCKDTIVLLSGENVEPVPIENKLGESKFIKQCLVIGQDQKHLTALLVTDLEVFRAEGIAAGNVEELARLPEAERLLNREIRAQVSVATGFKPFELIHDWRLVPKPFEVGDELTSTYKPRRHVITEKYATLIRDLYCEPEGGRRTTL